MKLIRRRYNTVGRRNRKAKWKLLVAFTLMGITAIIFPFALDVIKPKYDYFPQAIVHAEEVRESIPTTKPTETVEQTIRRLVKETNFKWESYLIKLAKCESSLKANATHDNGKNGIDRGVFQISNKYHKEVSDSQAFDVEFATKWTMEQINKGRQHEWMCDKIIRNK